MAAQLVDLWADQTVGTWVDAMAVMMAALMAALTVVRKADHWAGS